MMSTVSISRLRNALQREIQNFGVLNTMKDCAFRAVNQATYFNVFRAIMIDRITPRFMKTDRNYECRFLKPEEVLAFSRRPEFQLTQEFVWNALNKGDQCFAILDRKFLASYGWYSARPTQVNDELRLRFDQNYIYMYNGFTHRNYRGQRLHAVRLTRGLNEYLNRGARGVVFCVEESNHRSLRSISRVESLDFGRIAVLKLFNEYHIYHSLGCEERGFIMHANRQDRLPARNQTRRPAQKHDQSSMERQDQQVLPRQAVNDCVKPLP